MRYNSRLVNAIAFFLAVVVIGVLGYMGISKDTFVDSLYMTIITITTVGFGELHPLTDTEKLFTIFLILISILVYGYAVAAITEYLANGRLLKRLKTKKVEQKITKLKNHTVVCGYGRNGKQAILKLKNFNMPCLVIEKDKELIDELENDNVLYIEGDATDDESLKKANLTQAKSLITALPSDADNLFVVLSAHQLNEKLIIISRASNDSSLRKLKIAGADNIIMPDKIGGDHMASLVVTPDLVEFVDRLTISNECTTNLEEISVDDLPSKYINKTILDLDLRKQTGCNVIGFKTTGGEYIVNPEANVVLTLGAHLIVLGRPNQIEKLKDIV